MAVLHDYKCAAHGFFQAWEPKCKSGCTGDLIQKVFLQPVGMRSDSTRRSDETLGNLAKDYGMTNIQTPRGGESQMDASKRQQMQNPYAIQWGNPTAIGNYNTAPIAGESVNGLELGKETGRINPLRPTTVIKDHENLSIEK
jgi:hypothetical protein